MRKRTVKDMARDLERIDILVAYRGALERGYLEGGKNVEIYRLPNGHRIRIVSSPTFDRIDVFCETCGEALYERSVACEWVKTTTNERACKAHDLHKKPKRPKISFSED